MDSTSQLSAVRALVSSFPQGAVRAAVQEACDRVEEMVAPRGAVLPGEALVLAIHFIVQSKGYACTGLEEGAANASAAPSAMAPSAPPSGWNTNAGVYAIAYTHRSEPSRRIVLRGVEMGDTLAVNVVVAGDSTPEESYSVDVRALDYVSAAPAVPTSRGVAFAATVESLCPTSPRAVLSELLDRTLLAPIDAAAEARRAAQREAKREAVRTERARAEHAQRQRQQRQQQQQQQHGNAERERSGFSAGQFCKFG